MNPSGTATGMYFTAISFVLQAKWFLNVEADCAGPWCQRARGHHFICLTDNLKE